MITTDSNGFSKAELKTEHSAKLFAKYGGSDDFLVGHEAADGWYFTEKCCREAAEFFLKLADELKRRKEAN